MNWNEIRTGVLVISDRSSRGERGDLSGPALEKAVKDKGGRIVETAIVPDEIDAIVRHIRWLCGACDLVLTTGGTGASPRDVTPEATREVIERELPGFGEVMRAGSMKITTHAMISRAIAGISGKTLIINLPGSPRGAVECFTFTASAIPHTIELIRGEQVE